MGAKLSYISSLTIRCYDVLANTCWIVGIGRRCQTGFSSEPGWPQRTLWRRSALSRWPGNSLSLTIFLANSFSTRLYIHRRGALAAVWFVHASVPTWRSNPLRIRRIQSSNRWQLERSITVHRRCATVALCQRHTTAMQRCSWASRGLSTHQCKPQRSNSIIRNTPSRPTGELCADY